MATIPPNSVMSINLRFRAPGRSGYAMTTLKYYNTVQIQAMDAQKALQIANSANIQSFIDACQPLMYNDMTIGVYSIQFTGPVRGRIYFDGGSEGQFIQQQGTLGVRNGNDTPDMTQTTSLNIIKQSDAAGRRGIGHNYIPYEDQTGIVSDVVQKGFGRIAQFFASINTVMRNDIPLDGSPMRPCVIGANVSATGANNLVQIRIGDYATFMDSRRRDRGD